MRVIRSQDNPLAKQFALLAGSARHRRKCQQTVLEGIHLVEGYLQRHGSSGFIVVSERGMKHPEILKLLERPDLPEMAILGDALFDACASVDAAVGIAIFVDIPHIPLEGTLRESCLLLENIQDPGNLGTLLRSAAAAGIRQVLLSAGCALAWSPRVLRAGQGAHFHLQLHENVFLPEWARRVEGLVLGATVRQARPYWEVDLTGTVALIIGNEGAGITPLLQESLHERICVPMENPVESLNAAVAGSIILFERVRQLAGRR